MCIGVPYGTALWQIGDSKEQNGSFDIAMYQAKKELLEKKDDVLIDTDLIALINTAWKSSISQIDKKTKYTCW